MAQFEKPLNQIDFAKGEKPTENRLEEQYLYKYMTMKPPKINKTGKKEDDMDGDEDEDPSLEEFANKIIEDKMKQIQAGSGIQGESDEELDIEYTESEDEDVNDGKMEDSEQGEDFFEGEELSDVDFGQDAEENSDEDIDDGEVEQYGSEEEDIPAYEGEKKKDGKKEKKKKSDSNFASYEEFAHLLDGDSDEELRTKNLNAMMTGAKRTFT